MTTCTSTFYGHPCGQKDGHAGNHQSPDFSIKEKKGAIWAAGAGDSDRVLDALRAAYDAMSEMNDEHRPALLLVRSAIERLTAPKATGEGS
jgi:hypothetical protein